MYIGSLAARMMTDDDLRRQRLETLLKTWEHGICKNEECVDNYAKRATDQRDSTKQRTVIRAARLSHVRRSAVARPHGAAVCNEDRTASHTSPFIIFITIIIIIIIVVIIGSQPRMLATFQSLPKTMAGSSMRLVRLKPQGPVPVEARTARYNENLQSTSILGREISREKICSLQKLFSRHVDVCLVVSLFAPNCNYLF